MKAVELSSADIDYIRANYRTLRDLCRERGEDIADVQRLIRERRLPAPSYILAGEKRMVPADYFDLVDDAGGAKRLRQEFETRYRAAGGTASELAEDWDGYIGGLYGVCLRHVSPETIVRKGELVGSIEGLLARPTPEDQKWKEQLRREVEELDALEREFSPDYDRKRFGSVPSRDRLIALAPERYPDVFKKAAVHGR